MVKRTVASYLIKRRSFLVLTFVRNVFCFVLYPFLFVRLKSEIHAQSFAGYGYLCNRFSACKKTHAVPPCLRTHLLIRQKPCRYCCVIFFYRIIRQDEFCHKRTTVTKFVYPIVTVVRYNIVRFVLLRHLLLDAFLLIILLVALSAALRVCKYTIIVIKTQKRQYVFCNLSKYSSLSFILPFPNKLSIKLIRPRISSLISERFKLSNLRNTLVASI